MFFEPQQAFDHSPKSDPYPRDDNFGDSPRGDFILGGGIFRGHLPPGHAIRGVLVIF